MPPEELLLLADAADTLGLSRSRTDVLVRQKRLRVAARTPGGVRLFHPADVERVKAERDAERAEAKP